MSKTVLQRLVRVAMLSFALLLPHGLHAQGVTLNLKDVTVLEAVTRLQSQGNFTIVINSEEVDLQKRVSVSATDAPLNQVLAQIFAGQDALSAEEAAQHRAFAELADQTLKEDEN